MRVLIRSKLRWNKLEIQRTHHFETLTACLHGVRRNASRELGSRIGLVIVDEDGDDKVVGWVDSLVLEVMVSDRGGHRWWWSVTEEWWGEKNKRRKMREARRLLNQEEEAREGWRMLTGKGVLKLGSRVRELDPRSLSLGSRWGLELCRVDFSKPELIFEAVNALVVSESREA
ncbi:hypothetical protein Drorol1_Dr00001046 [Drosera rotundifolia]